jgi:sulfite oxidase
MRLREESALLAVLEEGDRVVTQEPPNAEAGPSALLQLITPARDRFLRCHFPVPRLGDDHSVEIAGAVANPGILSVADLGRMPAVTLTVITECAGNGRANLEPPVPGEQWNHLAVSTAQWTGVPLRSLIELRETAVEVVFGGADGPYRRSLPREVALDEGTILAWEMNGAPIPPPFGGPLRLVVPGWYGMASVKWLARIEAVEQPFQGEFQSRRYVYGPGNPVTRLRIKSMFAELPGMIAAGSSLRLTGFAWGGDGVARVDVEIDGERHEARLVGPLLPHAWRRFELDWTPLSPGRYVLGCRATASSGESQPDEADWNPLGYGINAVQRVEVTVI